MCTGSSAKLYEEEKGFGGPVSGLITGKQGSLRDSVMRADSHFNHFLEHKRVGELNSLFSRITGLR